MADLPVPEHPRHPIAPVPGSRAARPARRRGLGRQLPPPGGRCGRPRADRLGPRRRRRDRGDRDAGAVRARACSASCTRSGGSSRGSRRVVEAFVAAAGERAGRAAGRPAGVRGQDHGAGQAGGEGGAALSEHERGDRRRRRCRPGRTAVNARVARRTRRGDGERDRRDPPVEHERARRAPGRGRGRPGTRAAPARRARARPPPARPPPRRRRPRHLRARPRRRPWPRRRQASRPPQRCRRGGATLRAPLDPVAWRAHVLAGQGAHDVVAGGQAAERVGRDDRERRRS